jgi:hypothetical protein
VTGFVNSFDNMFGPPLRPNNQHFGHGNFTEMNTPASILAPNASGHSASGHNAVGPNTTGPNLLDQNHFNSSARVQDLFNGGPVNRPVTGNLMGRQSTFAQMIAGPNALDGDSGNELGHGALMGNGFVMREANIPANYPFISSKDRPNNQPGGSQNGIVNHPNIPTIATENNPVDLIDADLPMNDLGINDHNGNGGNGTLGCSEAQLQAQRYQDSFDVSEHLLLPSGGLLITRSSTSTSNITLALNIE